MLCPSSGHPGQPVTAAIVESLVRGGRVPGGGATSWNWCPEPACAVAFFEERGGLVEARALKVRAAGKDGEGPVPLCHCFGHTAEEIRRDGSIVEAITAKVRARTCRCEVMNPSGRCCLGEVLALTREASGGNVLPPLLRFPAGSKTSPGKGVLP